MENTGAFTFYADTNLTTLQISEGVTTIGTYSFGRCQSLTSVTIPGTVTAIAADAFSSCAKLDNVIFAGNAPSSMDPSAFNNTAPGLTIYYHLGATGYTTPTWLGHSCYPLAFPVRTAGASLKSQTAGSASIHDGINPTGVPTTVCYQYGSSPAYGNTTASKNIGSGKAAVAFNTTLTGLSPNTIYYYRLVMICTSGTFYGPDESFTTYEQGNGQYTAYLEGVWDLSGTYSGALTGGPGVDFLLNQDSSGKVLGSGTFTQHDALGAWSGTEDITGQIKSSGTTTALALVYACSGSGAQISGTSSDPSLFAGKLTLNFEVDAAGGNLVSKGGSFKYTATGRTTGKKVTATRKIAGGDTMSLPSGRTGDFDLSLDLTPGGALYSGTATGVASSGQTVGFNVTGKYSPKTGLSTLALKGGIGCTMNMSAGFYGSKIEIKSLKAKVLGQSVSD